MEDHCDLIYQILKYHHLRGAGSYTDGKVAAFSNDRHTVEKYQMLSRSLSEDSQKSLALS